MKLPKPLKYTIGIFGLLLCCNEADLSLTAIILTKGFGFALFIWSLKDDFYKNDDDGDKSTTTDCA